MKKRLFILAFLLQTGFLSGSRLSAQAHQDRWISMDVKYYRFEIRLNDSSDVIHCSAEVEILFKSEAAHFYLDLVKLGNDGRGMIIDRMKESKVLLDPDSWLLFEQG